jgi:D-alanyl-D-alanine carboxypeptidase/D-alanyl-D-alanine-endopeptidase (penicillin-binding protein 4)
MQKNRIPQLLTLSFLFLTGFARAQGLQQKLQTAFTRLQADSQCRYASLSLTVLDVKTGETVFAANPDMGLATASTLKTITTITAMHVLGPGHRFKTTVNQAVDANITTDGTYNGNLIITAGDDPTLGSWRWEETKNEAVLKEFVDGIKKAGIHRINGGIVANGINHTPQGWIWEDVGNYYGAAPNDLCWHENQYDILLQTTKPGRPVKVTGTIPAEPYLHIENNLITGSPGSGDNAYAYLPILSNTVNLSGTFAADESKDRIAVALPDPPYELARQLKQALIEAGISVSGRPVSEKMWIDSTNNATPSGSRELSVHYSPPLRKVIYWLNQKSINLYAEQLLLAMADTLRSNDTPSILANFWKPRGIDPNSLNVFDGSGLSPADRVTSRTMATILQTAVQEPWCNDFYDSLPVYNNMKIKSGSIINVLNYAGYQTHNGSQLCFAIFVNNYNGSSREIKEKIFKVLDELK